MAVRVLLIDDDPLIREIGREMLSRAGYAVTTAEDGAEGLKTVAEGDFDLLITDMVMPDADGLDVIREVRGRLPDLPVIAISSGGRVGADFYLKLASAMGANAVFPKPLRKEPFLALVEHVLKGGEAAAAA